MLHCDSFLPHGEISYEERGDDIINASMNKSMEKRWVLKAVGQVGRWRLVFILESPQDAVSVFKTGEDHRPFLITITTINSLKISYFIHSITQWRYLILFRINSKIQFCHLLLSGALVEDYANVGDLMSWNGEKEVAKERLIFTRSLVFHFLKCCSLVFHSFHCCWFRCLNARQYWCKRCC